MRVLFFGTSAGVPTPNRFTSAIGLKMMESKEWSLFDCGEGTQLRIMKSRLSISKLRRIFITHLHGDHVFGIFGLLSARRLMKVSTPVTIYAPRGFDYMLQTVIKTCSLELPFEIEIIEIEDKMKIEIPNLSIDVVSLSHSIESFGFVITKTIIKKKLDIEGLKSIGVEDKYLYRELKRGKNITFNDKIIYSKDFLDIKDEIKKIIISGDNDEPQRFLRFKDVDLMVHEATYTQSDFDKLPKKQMHTTAKKLAKTAKEMGVKRLILTHISPRYQRRERDLIKEAKEYFSGKLILARDLLEVDI